MKNCYILISILFCIAIRDAKAQHEYFVSVNRVTGSDSIIDSLPGVHLIQVGGSAYDKNNHRYFFIGTDFSSNNRLYGVNAISGAIISQPINTFNLNELWYDNANDSLYGLYYNGKTHLVSINISTSSIHIIDTLPVSGYTFGSTFLDEVNKTYVLQHSTSFYSCNLTSGNIVVTPAPSIFNQMVFDNSSATPYGLVAASTELLVSINVSNGNYNVIDTLPTNGCSFDQTSMDEISHVYTYCNPDTLYSVNVNSNSLIARPLFPVRMSSPQNVIELHYDNSNGILYALHWGTLDLTTGTNTVFVISKTIKLFPNPNTGQFTIAFVGAQNLVPATLEIYNVLGEKVYSKSYQPSANSYQLDLSSNPTGLYLYRVMDESGALLGKGKFVIEK